jgi:hypothetical protein
MTLDRTMHIPAYALPARTITEPPPFGAVLRVRHDSNRATLELRAIRLAEAPAYLSVTAPNALPHAAHGLTAMLEIAVQGPCFALVGKGLPDACALIRSTFKQRRTC